MFVRAGAGWFRHDEDLSPNPRGAPPRHLGADAARRRTGGAAGSGGRGGSRATSRATFGSPRAARTTRASARGPPSRTARRDGGAPEGALLAVATRDAFERGGRAEDSEDAAGGSEAAARRTAAADSAAALRGALRTLDGLSEDPDGSSEDAAGLRATLRAAAPATARLGGGG